VLLNVTAHRFDHFDGAIASDRLGAAAQAGTVAGLLRLVRLSEKGYILAAGTPGWAGGPTVHARRGDGKHKLSILASVTVENCLPVRTLMVFVSVLLAGGHFRHFCQVEYRIGCHSVNSIRWHFQVGHPDLALKASFLAGLSRRPIRSATPIFREGIRRK
jgi:hypothetical protein